MFRILLGLAFLALGVTALGDLMLKSNSFIGNDAKVEVVEEKVFGHDGEAHKVSISDIIHYDNGSTGFTITVTAIDVNGVSVRAPGDGYSQSLVVDEDIDEISVETSDASNRQSILHITNKYGSESALLIDGENVTKVDAVQFREAFQVLSPKALFAVIVNKNSYLGKVVEVKDGKIIIHDTQESIQLVGDMLRFWSADGTPRDVRLIDIQLILDQMGAIGCCPTAQSEAQSAAPNDQEKLKEILENNLELSQLAYRIAKGTVYIGKKPAQGYSTGSTGDWVTRHLPRASLVALGGRTCAVFGAPLENGTTWTKAAIMGVCTDDRSDAQLVRFRASDLKAPIRLGELNPGVIMPDSEPTVANMVGDSLALLTVEEASDLTDVGLKTASFKRKGKPVDITGLDVCVNGEVQLGESVRCVQRDGRKFYLQSDDGVRRSIDLPENAHYIGHDWEGAYTAIVTQNGFCVYYHTPDKTEEVGSCLSIDSAAKAALAEAEAQRLESVKCAVFHSGQDLFVLKYENPPFMNHLTGVADCTVDAKHVYLQNAATSDTDSVYSYFLSLDEPIFTRKLGTMRLGDESDGAPSRKNRVEFKYARIPFAIEAQQRLLMQQGAINSAKYKQLRSASVVDTADIVKVKSNSAFTDVFSVTVSGQETFIASTVNGKSGAITESELALQLPTDANGVRIYQRGENCTMVYKSQGSTFAQTCGILGHGLSWWVALLVISAICLF